MDNSILIDENNCMSRKNKLSGLLQQCPLKKKINDYCKKHSNSNNILRIDKSLPLEYINKLMDIYTIDQTEIKEFYKIRIFKGELIKTTKTNDYMYVNLPIKTFETNYNTLDKFNNKSKLEILDMISGPAYHNPLLSHNEIDSISQEQIWYYENDKKIVSDEIKKEMLFSYQDEDNFIRCFNIESLRGLFKQNIFNHPITCKPFSKQVIENAKIKIEILEEIGILDIEVENTELTEDKVKQYTFEVFSKFHKFNIYPKDSWFLNISLPNLGKMYYETKDFFLQNIPNIDKKKKLVPPDGIAFNYEVDFIKKCKNKEYVQYILLNNINKIISLCSDEALQTMGSYIALGGLATVSHEARDCYPHIAYSFM